MNIAGKCKLLEIMYRNDKECTTIEIKKKNTYMPTYHGSVIVKNITQTIYLGVEIQYCGLLKLNSNHKKYLQFL